MNEKIKRKIPYLVLLILSFFATYLIFYLGVGQGDDIKFHFSNIMDEYLTLKKGFALSPISGNIAMGLGVGNRLFYSPLPHLTVTLTAILLEVFHISMMTSFKIVLFLSVYLSGIIMYRFMMHVSLNHPVASLLAAGIYILYPYRLFDAFCRFAFAEAYSFMFLPLFFMGLYDLIHIDKSCPAKPFIEVILGGSMLFLSHNLTAFYAYVFGVVYLLFHCKKIFPLLKQKKFVGYSFLSVFLLIGLSSIMLFTQLQLMNTGLYNITDRVRMWTDLEAVLKRVNGFVNYSGFLNYPYLISNYPHLFSEWSLTLELLLFLLISASFIFLDMILAKVKKVARYHFCLAATFYILLVLLSAKRVEIYLAGAIVLIIYGSFLLLEKYEFKGEKLANNLTFWYSIIMIVVVMIMMSEQFVWKMLPAMFLNIQFPWRLWAFIQLFASMLIGLICTYYHPSSLIQKVFIVLLGFLMVCNQPLVEKRLLYERQEDIYTSNSWYVEIEEDLLDSGVALGFNKEYCPQVFFDSSYESEYPNSLYDIIRSRIRYDFYKYEDYSLKPAVLQGSAEIVINSAFAPSYQMEIQVMEDALIQLPLLYYPGYQITVTDEFGTVQVFDGENIDGLIAFSIVEGTYQVQTNYVGTTLRKVSYVYFAVSVAGVFCFGGLAAYFNKKKKKPVK